jgi:hypothetical protein
MSNGGLVLFVALTRDVIQSNDAQNGLIAVFLRFDGRPVIWSAERMAFNMPICQDHGRPYDAAEVPEASSVPPLAEPE